MSEVKIRKTLSTSEHWILGHMKGMGSMHRPSAMRLFGILAHAIEHNEKNPTKQLTIKDLFEMAKEEMPGILEDYENGGYGDLD